MEGPKELSRIWIIAGLVFLHPDTPTWHNVYDVFTETVCIMILRLSSRLNIPHPLTSILYISSSNLLSLPYLYSFSSTFPSSLSGVPLCYFPLHMAVYPPSTGNPTPVIQLQSSEARNTAVRAISSGSPRPRKGCIFSSFVRNSESAKMLAVIAVPTSVFVGITSGDT